MIETRVYFFTYELFRTLDTFWNDRNDNIIWLRFYATYESC